ncbi:hypothetical protein K466DRAFT_571347 [Polyporus arcularius HHB13444]|uniref:Uncharacterized protein n=1 Tax=Polyporus arcularius HHB13444 TaxID=1314778 RepID=A0A5C3NKW3_9APHY|nr:hypothetical protein K466DRAFT_571347 [Polyporus arcularius HHB13444]
MKECQPPYPKLGDLMWFSFVVEIFIGTKNWITKFVPLEFVRVGRVSTDLLGEVHSFVPDEEEMQPRSRLIAGDEIAIGEDFPMFGLNGPPVLREENPVANNEVHFGPLDAQRYRNLRRDLEDASPGPRAIVSSSISTDDAYEDDAYEDGDGVGRAAGKDDPVSDEQGGAAEDGGGLREPHTPRRETVTVGGIGDLVINEVDAQVENRSPRRRTLPMISAGTSPAPGAGADDGSSPPPTPTPSPKKKASRKRRASTERPAHAEESSSRTLRDRKNTRKSGM